MLTALRLLRAALFRLQKWAVLLKCQINIKSSENLSFHMCLSQVGKSLLLSWLIIWQFLTRRSINLKNFLKLLKFSNFLSLRELLKWFWMSLLGDNQQFLLCFPTYSQGPQMVWEWWDYPSFWGVEGLLVDGIRQRSRNFSCVLFYFFTTDLIFR